MQTVSIPARKSKGTFAYKDSLVDEVIAALGKVKKGEAVAYDEEWYPNQGKARTRARVMALAVAAKIGTQPKTHCVPTEDWKSDDNDAKESFTPALSMPTK